MAHNPMQDKRVELLKERLEDDLVDDDGNAVDRENVDQAVDAAAAPFTDAPIQEFTPLLIEHDAMNTLREQGFHRQLGDEADDAPVHDTGSTDDPGSIHLSSQQGLAMPEPD